MYKLLLIIESSSKPGVSTQLLEFKTLEELRIARDIIYAINEKSDSIAISTIEFRYE